MSTDRSEGNVEDKEEIPSHPIAHQAVASIAQSVPDLSKKDKRAKVHCCILMTADCRYCVFSCDKIRAGYVHKKDLLERQIQSIAPQSFLKSAQIVYQHTVLGSA